MLRSFVWSRPVCFYIVSYLERHGKTHSCKTLFVFLAQSSAAIWHIVNTCQHMRTRRTVREAKPVDKLSLRSLARERPRLTSAEHAS